MFSSASRHVSVILSGGIIVLICLVLVRTGSAQELDPLENQSIRFDSLTISAGLSQNSVYAILQDQQGFLWLGTEDGLNRYDGNNFVVFKPDPENANSLTDRWITALAQDDAGRIWIGTRLGGLNVYDPISGRFEHHRANSADPSSLPGDTVQALLFDQQDTMWIGTNQGLSRYWLEDGSFELFQHEPSQENSLIDNDVRALCQDQAGNLWVGTSAGLDLYKPEQDGFIHFQHDPTDPASLVSNAINVIYEDRQGHLWIGTQRGLSRMDFQPQLFRNYSAGLHDPNSLSSGRVYTIFEDRFDSLWVGTQDGLNRYEPFSDHFVSYYPDPLNPSSINSETILSIYEDRGGVLWFGTYGGGVNKLDRGRMKFIHYQHIPAVTSSLSANLVFGLAEDHLGNIWIATYGGGLNRFDPRLGIFSQYRHVPSNPYSLSDDQVRAVYEDRDGNIWVGTESGLDLYIRTTRKFKHYQFQPNNPRGLSGIPVTDILEDQQGNFWVATSVGLDLLDRETGFFTHYFPDPLDPNSLSDATITCLFESQEGELWVGTLLGGLNRFDPETQTFHHYRHNINQPGSLSDDSVLTIFQDRNGVIWIGTAGGLNRFDRHLESFRYFTEKSGLPSDTVFGILEDDQGYLWLSTNNGVARFDPLLEAFKIFDEHDGLQSKEFNPGSALETQSGLMLFGGVNGLNIFDPQDIQDNLYLPPVVLTSLAVAGDAFELDGTIEHLQSLTLRWPNNQFDFEFAALSFADPGSNLYSYKLEGFDQNWTRASTLTQGRYTNLPGGSYTLMIKGSNNDGIWSESGISIAVEVIPPFWQTAWFYGLLGVFLLAMVTGAWKLRTAAIQARNRNLEQQVLQRTQEIERLFDRTKELAILNERNRLARDLHDSAKQKAFAALAQVGAARQMLQRDSVAGFQRLEEAEQLVHDVIQELTFLIQEMYPRVLKEQGLANVLRGYIFEWENRTGISVKLSIEGERRLSLDIEQACYRILQEALANVARHSQAAQVETRLEFGPDVVRLEVLDDGCGFYPQPSLVGIGLRSMQERADSLGGVLVIESQPDRGTKLAVQFPFGT